MSDSPRPSAAANTPPDRGPSAARAVVEQIGAAAGGKIDQTLRTVRNIGGMAYLLGDCLWAVAECVFKPGVRLNRSALAAQMTRVGVDSIGIVVLVQMFIGAILVLQLAPTLRSYGQLDRVAEVVAIAMVREMGPLITAIVLSGFAGASIAAEIGAMVESEEIKALRAHALSPIRFLIVPRFLATVVMSVGLAVIANVIGIFGGFLTAWGVLDIAPEVYIDLTQNSLVVKDLVSGLVKAGVFGMLIALIACHQGLHVSGGAVGVGRATTVTVVQSIVGIIGMDAAFTAVFYTFGI